MVNSTFPLSIVTRSLATTAVGPISLNGASFNGEIPFGENRAVTFSVPQVRLPYPAATNRTDFADSYEWTIPAGWQFESFSGTTARTTTNSVRVIPSPSGAGSISVRALDTFCNWYLLAGQAVSRTEPFVQPITRPVPPLRIISDQTPQGGNISLTCGQDLPNVRPGVGTLPAGGSFGNYLFSAGGIVSGSSGLNTATPVFVLTRPGTGTISLQATYSRNGASIPVVAQAITVQVSSQVVNPTISPLPVASVAGIPGLCGPLTVTAAAVGATEYYWSATNGILVNGAPTATVVAGASVTLTPPPGGVIGRGVVTVESRNPAKGCQAGSTPLYFTFGVPPVPDLFTLQGYCFDYPANGPGLSFLVCPGENLSLSPALFNLAGQSYEGIVRQYEWTISGDGISAPGFGSSRYFFTAPFQPRRNFTVTLRLRNDCGSSLVGMARFTTLDADGGEEPFRMGPTRPATAYPNPANGTLTLEQPAGTVLTIRNSQGQPVYQGRAGQVPIRLDTRAWPAGLYFLHSRHGLQTERQQLQIKH